MNRQIPGLIDAATALALIAATAWAIGVSYDSAFLRSYGLVNTSFQYDTRTTIYNGFFVSFDVPVIRIVWFLCLVVLSAALLLYIVMQRRLLDANDRRRSRYLKLKRLASGTLIGLLPVFPLGLVYVASNAGHQAAKQQYVRFAQGKLPQYTFEFKSEAEHTVTCHGWPLFFGVPFSVFFDSYAKAPLIVSTEKIILVQQKPAESVTESQQPVPSVHLTPTNPPVPFSTTDFPIEQALPCALRNKSN